MEAGTGNANQQPGVLNRILPVVLPVLLISVGYVDIGKWVATVEGGARFGFDLVAPMLLFNFAAVLCQYLSARIGVVTGKDLAQVQFILLILALIARLFSPHILLYGCFMQLYHL